MDASMQRYADNLKTEEAAQSYSTKYQRIWHKRLSDSRERAVIRAALALTGGPHSRVLDMPCGAGRLTRELLPFGKEFYCADYSPEQLKICKSRYPDENLKVVQASCFELPFEADFFDLAFSVRLSHHIGDPDQRVRYLEELFRVSKRYVIATFFDARSFKNRLREFRRTFLGSRKRGKFTMSMEQLAKIAAASNWDMKAAIPISRIASGHKYVVFEKRED
ncbi:MAG: class I SAM-dependent methyltransferase [Planctomycetota bacterium]|nr:class I SAM-dependent methyltransferase [Planctomycetota bacterium]